MRSSTELKMTSLPTLELAQDDGGEPLVRRQSSTSDTFSSP